VMFVELSDVDSLGYAAIPWDEIANGFWLREQRQWTPEKRGPKFGSVAGEFNPSAKLKHEDAVVIRRSNEPLKKLLQRFPNVSMNTIKAIRAGRIWKDAGAKVVRGPKIPPHLVPDVVRRADAGESQRDIAKSLGVSQGLVWKTISQARSAMPAERTRAS